ncbi:MAG: hypothetical protein C0600_12860 [Ignavibacteria bacterium]|nr:MAG: hypothetical protein C0600_12860 [Ignavibacteria bacterium]
MYAEYVIGDLTHRGKVYSTKDFKLNGERRECYRSLFLYEQSLKDWTDKTGSVKGYNGDHTSDMFPIDVDFDGNLEAAKDEAERIMGNLTVLYEVPVEYMRIAFSGSKGFHIVIPIQAFTDSPKPQKDFYKVFLGIAHDVLDGFSGVDFKIYESKRIFRMSNTINAKTGLYKIPLTHHEFRSMSIEEIQELAKEPRKIYNLPVEEISVVAPLNDLYEKHRNMKPEPVKKETTDVLDLLSGSGTGGRNEALTRLCGLFTSRGFDETLTLQLLRMWNERNSPPLPDEELMATVEKLFRSYGKPSEMKLYSIAETGASYYDYVQKLQTSRVNIGFAQIDDVTRGIGPGQVLNILGKTAVGKTAFLQNIGRNYSQDTGEPVVMFSLEMQKEAVFEREFQMEMGVSGYDAENAFTGSREEAMDHVKRCAEATPSMYITDQAGLTLEDVKAYVRYGEAEVYKRKTGLVMIDYMGLIHGSGNDAYNAVSAVARNIKNVAKELDVPLVSLVQVGRKKKTGDELEMDDGRDSGAIEEASDYIVGLWRAQQQTDDENILLQVGLLKNRRGRLGKWQGRMHKRSLRFEVIGDDLLAQGESQLKF